MKDPHKEIPNKNKKAEESEEERKDRKEKKLDEQVEESFPASDTPSHVQPGSSSKKK